VVEVDSVRVLHEQCERNKSEDKKLPSDSFLVTYKVDEELKYDVARGGSTVEVFDHYYDKYKNVQGIAWTKGIVNPRTFDCTYDEPEKTKKKRKRKE
tara:strand:+ start:38 stop:328 length:291 start_codon:yes stop_codon:yes gene_type:complete